MFGKSNSKDSLHVYAPAKVNLSLKIIEKRIDGYHELQSVMQKVSLFDIIRLHPLHTSGIELSCPDSGLPEDDSNLVWKAARAFFEEAGLADTCGVSIILEKNIPVAAGLGGGSSDAGAVLNGLNTLFKAEIPEQRLLQLAVVLGADVPFFVSPHTAVYATGIGDIMQKHKTLKDCSLVLVNPGIFVSTAWVYKNYTLTMVDKDSNLSDSRENNSCDKGHCHLYNDLESVTIERYPEIQAIKDFFLLNGADDALMSGSGPTVFGVFSDNNNESNQLESCTKKLVDRYGEGVFVTRPI